MKIITKNKYLILILTLLFSALLINGHSFALGQYTKGSLGVDVSYPNCKSSIPNVSFGIVGVNNGKPFSLNPCLKSQASKFKNLSLYVNSAYPGQPYGVNYKNSPISCSELDLNCLAYNYGFNAAQYSFEQAAIQGISSQTWWIDVETMNSWVDDTNQNRQSIQGMVDYLKSKGATTVGIYSTTFQWNLISGNWINFLPSWGATTWRNAKQASTYCKGHEFTGGPSYLMQFTGKSLDQDVAC